MCSPLRAHEDLPPLFEAVATRVNLIEGASLATQFALQAFYDEQGYAPLWVDETGFKPDAKDLIGEMSRADDWGLSAAAYQVAPPSDSSDYELAQAEVRLSLALLQYVEDARGGRIPQPSEQLSSYLDRRPDLPDPMQVMRGFAARTDPVAYLLSFHPQHEQFARLRAAYLMLKADEARFSVTFSEDAPDLRKGMDDAEVSLLRKRLGLEPSSTLFDDELEAAVREFQLERGLQQADGVVGSRTRRALNTADPSKLPILRANMELWRWMPADLGRSYVLINVPEFKAELIKDDAVAFRERVIVGTREAQTPIFSQNMVSVVLHPRWYVPETIKLKELLPSLRRGRSLEGRGFVLLHNGKEVSSRRVNWATADMRSFDLYQKSGDDNALGQVKLLFPNKHAVYLHDTPNRELFNSEVRAFSHGCVRLRNPLEFVHLLLNADKGWSEEDVKDLTENGPFDNTITLGKPLPVHIAYFTAWVNDEGELRVMQDVYGHQKRILLALDGRWSEIDKGKDHLAPVEIVDIAQPKPKRAAKVSDPAWGGPMGLFGTATAPRSYGTSSNDIFRRSFGN
jgi:murein L,D-transpeptidase YcbB/YkuD